MEGQYSRTEQTEDGISELEDEMVIIGKTKELLLKQLNTYEKKMQELTNSIKRQNLRMMGIEEGEEVQAKGKHNTFNKIITEYFPNLEKSIPYRCKRTPEHQTDQIKIGLPHSIPSLQQLVQKLGKQY
jgi:hypothetical protein